VRIRNITRRIAALMASTVAVAVGAAPAYAGLPSLPDPDADTWNATRAFQLNAPWKGGVL
jgi:hypothetical protein